MTELRIDPDLFSRRLKQLYDAWQARIASRAVPKVLLQMF